MEFRGDVKPTIQDVLGGIRSACTYVGAPKLKELSKRATFVQVRFLDLVKIMWLAPRRGDKAFAMKLINENASFKSFDGIES